MSVSKGQAIVLTDSGTTVQFWGDQSGLREKPKIPLDATNFLIQLMLIENIYIVVMYQNKVCIYDDEGNLLQTTAKLPEANKAGIKL
jgi:hypothetical protein